MSTRKDGQNNTFLNTADGWDTFLKFGNSRWAI